MCFLQNEMRNLTGRLKGRLRNRVQKAVGSRKLVKESRTGRGLSLDSRLPRGSSQDEFPKLSLFTTANGRCQPLYRLAKTAITQACAVCSPETPASVSDMGILRQLAGPTLNLNALVQQDDV